VTPWRLPEPIDWWHTVDAAISEDLGHGDITGSALPSDLFVDWYIEAQGDGVLCGVGIAEHLLAPTPDDPDRCDIRIHKVDGEQVRRGEKVLSGTGLAQRVLISERVSLNFLMHLSGIGTLTGEFVARVEGTHARVVDTRKTLPGLRSLQKYAVRCGGGHNHRMGLFDGVMIKDNHIIAFGGIRAAIAAVRDQAPHTVRIEVECENLAQVKEAVEAGAEIILLDNMDPFTMREAVQMAQGRALLEASGGISLETIRGVAQTGVDIISVGALTHSAVALPLHLEMR
jgi:nicotinate-nucleotide pyrophosphorylase (carboxylating)